VKSKVIFKKEYDGESIVDLPEDIHYALEECGVPQDEYGLHRGTFVVTIKWDDREINYDE
jgi:hypothetical protein